jgi:ABC-type antimicrobial peptide transport system permease subunit
VRTPRFYTFLLATFGGASALLVAVGIAGVMAMAVTHRTREIGLRIALGATPASVVRLVLQGTGALALFGLSLGMGGALFLTRLLAAQLHELSPGDPLTMGAAVAFMLLVSLLAAWVPARGVTRVDPASVLRAE